MPNLLSIALFVFAFISGLLTGRAFKRNKIRLNTFNTIGDTSPLTSEEIKEAQSKFRTFSPSKRQAEQSLEKQLNEDNI